MRKTRRRTWLEKTQLMLALVSLTMFTVPVQAIEVAGELFVDLSASDPSAGTATWTNSGTLGSFSAVGAPMLTTIGTAPAVTFDGTNDAYIGAENAPAGLVGVDPTRTIEAWVFNPSIASEETIVSWGKRGGPEGSNMSFNYGNHGNFGAVGHWGGDTADLGWVNNAPDFTPGAPEANLWHHLVYTYDGTTTRAYSDGVLQNSEVLGAGVINTHNDTEIAIASQWDADGATLTGALRGSLSIGQMRIHDGVLSDAQILSNFNAERAAYGNPLPPLPGPLQGLPIHRYSFSDAATLTDSIGGADGVVKGAGATFTDTHMKLPGGSSDSAAYGDLPNGLISGLTDVTFEGWVSVDGAQNWQRIFDFGSNSPGGPDGELDGPGDTNGGDTQGLDYFFLSGARGAEINQQRVEVRNEDPAGGGITTVDANQATTAGEEFHFVVTYDADGAADGGPMIRYFRNGELQNEGATAISLSEINDVNNWLGRSNWTNDANFEGSFNEFRIYDRPLSQNEILGNAERGPDVVPEPSAIVMLILGLLGLFAGVRRRKR